MTDGGRNRNGYDNRSRGRGYYSNRLSSSEPADTRQASRSDRRSTRGTDVSAYRASSGRYQSEHAQSRRSAPVSSSSSDLKPSVRFIVLAIAALALIVAIGFIMSRCMGPGSQGGESSSKAVSASAATVSASSGASEASASASASEPAASAAASEPAASATAATSTTSAAATVPIVNAQPGDVTYLVAEAAKLKHRDADFAVNPARTTWNYDQSNGRKTIYLTFDDGPSANTERVLDVLDQYDCKATFFVTGQNPEYFPWIKEAYDRGHTIGLHSYTHDYESCYSSVDAFWNEFDRIGEAVKEQIGYVPCFIRFPGGASNTISASYSQGIMTTLAADVLSRGYQYYDWEYSCGDGAVHTADELVDAGCQPLDEDNVIYLLHDGSAKETTAEALPRIIEYYRDQGYSFEALDRNTLVYQHDISN